MALDMSQLPMRAQATAAQSDGRRQSGRGQPLPAPVRGLCLQLWLLDPAQHHHWDLWLGRSGLRDRWLSRDLDHRHRHEQPCCACRQSCNSHGTYWLVRRAAPRPFDVLAYQSAPSLRHATCGDASCEFMLPKPLAWHRRLTLRLATTGCASKLATLRRPWSSLSRLSWNTGARSAGRTGTGPSA